LVVTVLDGGRFDAVDRVARAARGPVFLLGLARPELTEQRPEVAQDDLLTLEPLAAADIEILLTERAGPLEPATLRGIVDVSHGNPLFAEQMLAALSDGTADAVPLSLRGLLTMRLDRLGPGERDLLRGASVIGMDFDRNALSALLPDDAVPFIERHLDTLERKRFIERTDGNTFRFRHVMIQLAAYHTTTREDRARLHERLARWLEQQPPLMSAELGAILGDRLAHAGKHRRMSGLTS
jgi:predicted ATPase